ncbi:MAG: NAD-binding protein, partial [Gammaproteobacteria bacterium]
AGAAAALADHVIICGFGRTGGNVAHFLKRQHIACVAIDNDIDRVRAGLEAGALIFYGDAGHGDLLKAAGLSRARALLVSFADDRNALRIVHTAHTERPNLPILVRARDEAALERLLEASIMLATQLLLLLGLPSGEVFRAMNAVRGERYRLLAGLFTSMRGADESDDPRQLHTIVLPADAYAVGRRLQQLELAASGVALTVLRRGSRYGTSAADFVLAAGDVLVMYGSPDQLDAAENRLFNG